MIDKSIVGQTTQAKTVMVEQGQLQFFAKATGAEDPIYWDLEKAQAAGHPGIPAPPTFLITLDLLAPSKDTSVLETLGIDIGQILHGEQRFRFERQIYAGDEISITSKIIDVYEKKAGALQFIVSETQATNQHGESVGTMTNSIIVRS